MGFFGAGSVHAATGDLVWVKTSNPSNYHDIAWDIVTDSTGLYVVGYDYASGYGDARWSIQKRSLGTGALIWAKASNPSSLDDMAYGVAVDNSGLYVAGCDRFSGSENTRWRIEKRSRSTGALVWAKTSDPSSADDIAFGVAVDSSGVYIVGFDGVLGFGGDGWDFRWRIEKRSRSTGALVWAKTSNPGNGMDVAVSVAVDSSGLYIVGEHLYSEGDAGWRIEKRSLMSGALMWARESNPSTFNDYPYDVAADSSGLYIAGCDDVIGFYGDEGGENFEWRIEKRSLSTGALTWVMMSNPSGNEDVAQGIAVTSSGLYVVGYDRASTAMDCRWRIEKRSPSTGAPVWTKASNPSIRDDIAYCVAATSSGLYVAGYDNVPTVYPDTRLRIEKRIP